MATVTTYKCDECQDKIEHVGPGAPEGWGGVDLNIHLFGSKEKCAALLEVVRENFKGKYNLLHLCNKCIVKPEVWLPMRLLKKWIG